MKKKIVGMLLTGVMSVSMLTGCSGSSGGAVTTEAPKEQETPTEVAEEGEKAVLRVGMECAYAPFNFVTLWARLSRLETCISMYSSLRLA